MSDNQGLFRLYQIAALEAVRSVRALDKREYLVIIMGEFLLILHKTISCDPSSEPSH